MNVIVVDVVVVIFVVWFYLTSLHFLGANNHCLDTKQQKKINPYLERSTNNFVESLFMLLMLVKLQ